MTKVTFFFALERHLRSGRGRKHYAHSTGGESGRGEWARISRHAPSRYSVKEVSRSEDNDVSLRVAEESKMVGQVRTARQTNLHKLRLQIWKQKLCRSLIGANVGDHTKISLPIQSVAMDVDLAFPHYHVP